MRSGTLLLFPGQGSQAIGMGAHLLQASAEARETFAEAGELLGWDVRRLCLEGPLEELTRTDRAQPAIFVCSIAAWRTLAAAGADFDIALGHSLGDYSALAATGQLAFGDALRVVAARGAAMWACGEREPGTMAAVLGLDDELIEEICRLAGDVWPANYNAPGQVVVSGTPEGVARVSAFALDKGARRVMPLQVSGAFHSPLVAEAADELARVLSGLAIHPPARGRFFATTELRYPEVDEVRDTLLRQLTSPVRFTQSLRRVLPESSLSIEVGPGNVLAGLVKRVDRRFPVYGTAESGAFAEVKALLGPGCTTGRDADGPENDRGRNQR
jgi:[acyl-carrier-protein] S-malonyltransferase